MIVKIKELFLKIIIKIKIKKLKKNKKKITDLGKITVIIKKKIIDRE